MIGFGTVSAFFAGNAGGRLTAFVGYIKTIAFKNDAGSAINKTPQLLTAFWTGFYGFILKALKHFKAMHATFALIFIGRHINLNITKINQKVKLFGFH